MVTGQSPTRSGCGGRCSGCRARRCGEPSGQRPEDLTPATGRSNESARRSDLPPLGSPAGRQAAHEVIGDAEMAIWAIDKVLDIAVAIQGRYRIEGPFPAIIEENRPLVQRFAITTPTSTNAHTPRSKKRRTRPRRRP